MKKLFFLAALFVGCICLTACGGDDPASGITTDDAHVALEPCSVNVEAAGGTFTINVKTSAKEWTAFATDDCASWVKATPNAQAGTINIVVSANNTEASREGTVTYKSGANRKYVTIVQKAPMVVNPETLVFSSKGETLFASVKCTGEWKAESKADWFTIKKVENSSPTANSIPGIEVTTTPNEDTKDRTDEIVITCGSEQKKIKVTQSGADDANITVPAGYHLVWNDEFSEGTELDKSKWTHEVWPAYNVNNEQQAYVNHKTSSGKLVSEVKDGKMLLHCLKDGGKIYSARVYGNMNKGFKYGYFEAKIKLPKGKGTWPAFWMMPSNNNYSTNPWPGCGEIDIMEEVGYDPGHVYATIHCTRYNNGGSATEHGGKVVKDAEDAFHVYACEWTEQYLQFFVDGVSILKYNPSDRTKNYWPFNVPFYPILNIAWGGVWGGQNGTDESALPCTMEVDYVRVFQKN